MSLSQAARERVPRSRTSSSKRVVQEAAQEVDDATLHGVVGHHAERALGLGFALGGWAVPQPPGGVGHADPEREPLEPEAPGVLDELGLLEGLAIRVIDAPADAGLLDPAAEGLEVAVLDAEAATERLHRQQIEHGDRADPVLPSGHGQHPQQDLGHGVGAAEAALGDRPGDAGRARGAPALLELHDGPAIALCGALRTLVEDRADQGHPGLDVGHHHQHVAGLEVGVGLKEVEQSLAQHLDLPGGAVAGVNPQRVVVLEEGPRPALRLAEGGGVAEVQHVGLQHVQGAGGALARALELGREVDEGLHPGVVHHALVEPLEHQLHVASHTAH